MIKNQYPPDLIKLTLNSLGKTTVYTMRDVGGAFNLLQDKDEDEHKFAL